MIARVPCGNLRRKPLSRRPEQQSGVVEAERTEFLQRIVKNSVMHGIQPDDLEKNLRKLGFGGNQWRYTSILEKKKKPNEQSGEIGLKQNKPKDNVQIQFRYRDFISPILSSLKSAPPKLKLWAWPITYYVHWADLCQPCLDFVVRPNRDVVCVKPANEECK